MKKFILLTFALFIGLFAKAQHGFRVEIFNEPFEYLEGATPLVDSLDEWDDPDLQIPLGFTTTIFGDTTSTLYTQGDLGGILFFKDYYDYDTSATFSFYGTDLIDRANVDGIPYSPISAITEGAAGDRIFKFEYKDAGFYDEVINLDTASNKVSIQFWLYEGDATWELRIGPSEIPNPDAAWDNNSSGPIVGMGKSFEGGFTEFYTVNEQNNPATLDSIDVNDAFEYTVTNPDSSLVIRFYQLALDTKSPVQLEGIELFPSLAEDVVNVSIDNLDVLNQEVAIKVYDLSGRRYYYNQSKQEALHEIQVGHLVAGKYFVSIQTEDGFKTVPFVKM